MNKILLLFLLLPFKSMAQAPATPIDMNDHLATYTDTLFSLGQNWGNAYNTASQTKNYASLETQSGNMIRFIDKAAAHIKQLKDVKGSKDLRLAMISFLDFEKDMAQKGFLPFEAFTKDTPESTIKAAMDNLIKLSAQESNFLTTVAAEQSKYGAANGFKIEAKKD